LEAGILHPKTDHYHTYSILALLISICVLIGLIVYIIYTYKKKLKNTIDTVTSKGPDYTSENEEYEDNKLDREDFDRKIKWDIIEYRNKSHSIFDSPSSGSPKEMLTQSLVSVGATRLMFFE